MNIKKTLWFSLGIVLLGVAFIGIYLPGLPTSTPDLTGTGYDTSVDGIPYYNTTDEKLFMNYSYSTSFC